jgi:hypothetical protein
MQPTTRCSMRSCRGCTPAIEFCYLSFIEIHKAGGKNRQSETSRTAWAIGEVACMATTRTARKRKATSSRKSGRTLYARRYTLDFRDRMYVATLVEVPTRIDF